MSLIISSLYACMNALIYIIRRFSVVVAFLIRKVNSVGLSLSIVIWSVLLSMFLRSCCNSSAASLALAKAKLSAPSTYRTKRLDFMLA